MTPARSLSLSCVILTQGERPVELDRAIESLRSQHGEPVEIVLVANGGCEVPARNGVDLVRLPNNVGIPAGRNAGTRRTTGDVVVYLDDDGWLPDRGSAHRLRDAFRADPRLGVVSFRILDPATGRTERRHVPRLRVGNPERSSDVTTFLGGACAIRRSVIEECGEFADRFFYGHEETDFAWRALDRGHRIRYDAGLLMYHPGGGAAERHRDFYYFNARNRVWVARRHLPPPLGVLYVATWTLLTAARERRLSALHRWGQGFLAGLREDPGTRRPLSWRTIWTMTVLGRPPVV